MLILLLASSSVPAFAQAWNDARTRALVSRATERRAQQLADTGLTDYIASAHGYLTFLAQVGEGFPDPPKVVKADEIGLEVYWRAPNHSKQLIVGRRDTLLLPTDIQYHRDHLGIVQNNFPSIIRLGEGDEVRDVPHPLSAAGMAAYDFAIRDSLRISIPGRIIDVYEVRIRPRDERAPMAVGAVYLARDDAQVVRMAFSFTRAALIDPHLEDVSIVLDNALTEERFWLPRRQEIEIRRTGTWLDFPARGIIRGRWEICCYQVNQGLPVEQFVGPEIVLAPPARRAAHRFAGTIMEALPAEVRAATDEDVRRVQAEARALVRREALARSRQTSLTSASVSEFVRFNRAEGLSVGAGVRQRVGGGWSVMATARLGFSDHEPKGSLAVGWRGATGAGVQVEAVREYREARDVAEASGLRNSLAAQEFGSDYSEPFDVRGVLVAGEGALGASDRLRWRAEGGYEWVDPVAVVARPAHGTFAPTLPVPSGEGPRLSLHLSRASGAWLSGTLAARGELRVGSLTSNGAARNRFARLFATASWQRPVGRGTLVWEAAGGGVAARDSVPAQHLLFAGGPVTAPGYETHHFTAERLVTQRLEWRIPVPFVAIPLGRWGRIPGQATIVPLLNAVYVSRNASFRPPADGWYPSVGLGFMALFDLVRVDVGRGLRDGRWTFGVDLTRDLWPIL
ncbi:MAG TPA: hypothetical protein VLE53_00935 [Gemmatimonadaceae bacterium]|nr:hypothetical protein [Gemmatimonadaceae bacterium]